MNPGKTGAGWVDPALEAEFPGLALMTRGCPGPVAADPGVTERLDAVASRVRGRTAVEMRRETVPAAYRARFPEDPAATSLENLGRFEDEHPEVFAGMYQFWVAKPSALA